MYIKSCTYILQVGEIAEQIKIAFKQRIAEKPWVDETTKKRSKEKVLTIDIKTIILAQSWVIVGSKY